MVIVVVLLPLSMSRRHERAKQLVARFAFTVDSAKWKLMTQAVFRNLAAPSFVLDKELGVAEWARLRELRGWLLYFVTELLHDFSAYQCLSYAWCARRVGLRELAPELRQFRCCLSQSDDYDRIVCVVFEDFPIQQAYIPTQQRYDYVEPLASTRVDSGQSLPPAPSGVPYSVSSPAFFVHQTVYETLVLNVHAIGSLHARTVERLQVLCAFSQKHPTEINQSTTSPASFTVSLRDTLHNALCALPPALLSLVPAPSTRPSVPSISPAVSASAYGEQLADAR